MSGIYLSAGVGYFIQRRTELEKETLIIYHDIENNLNFHYYRLDEKKEILHDKFGFVASLGFEKAFYGHIGLFGEIKYFQIEIMNKNELMLSFNLGSRFYLP